MTRNADRPRPAYVVNYKSELRTKWCILPDMPRYVDSIVLADSNGRVWAKSPMPNNVMVYALSSAKLDDVARILDQWDPLPQIRSTFVTVGINNRMEDASTTLAALQRMHNWSTGSGKRVFFVGMPRFSTLIPLVQHCVTKMNGSRLTSSVSTTFPPSPTTELRWPIRTT